MGFGAGSARRLPPPSCRAQGCVPMEQVPAPACPLGWEKKVVVGEQRVWVGGLCSTRSAQWRNEDLRLGAEAQLLPHLAFSMEKEQAALLVPYSGAWAAFLMLIRSSSTLVLFGSVLPMRLFQPRPLVWMGVSGPGLWDNSELPWMWVVMNSREPAPLLGMTWDLQRFPWR